MIQGIVNIHDSLNSFLGIPVIMQGVDVVSFSGPLIYFQEINNQSDSEYQSIKNIYDDSGNLKERIQKSEKIDMQYTLSDSGKPENYANIYDLKTRIELFFHRSDFYALARKEKVGYTIISPPQKSIVNIDNFLEIRYIMEVRYFYVIDQIFDHSTGIIEIVNL